MNISYLKNNQNYSTEKSNEDVQILIKKDKEHVIVTVEALTDITLKNATDVIPFEVNSNDLYFLNGYQSWTDTKEFKREDKLRNVKHCPRLITKLYGLDKYGDSIFYEYSSKKSHGYDVFYAKGEHECFIYSANYKNGYLIIEIYKDKKDLFLTSMVENTSLKKGEKLVVFDYYLFFNYEEGLKSFKTVYPENAPEKLFGYTSWYNYYQNINEEIIMRDLEALDSRFNIFQIDDGYETFVGDWLDVDQKKFPNGLKPIVDKIHQKGYKAGLWLAPFVAEEKSKLFNEHRDWFIKNEKGQPFKVGGNWSGQYALDLDNKDVRDYIEKCLKHYMDMGFDFFKLDFLYAAGIPLYPGRSRCQAQYEAYQFLRNVLKGKLILGCGANVINSYSSFDYLRVGPDVSLIFDDAPIMRLLHRERISTKVTLQNTMFRSIFNNHLFGNDPDVFLLRNENIKLSFEQRKALTTINALFGSVLMTSDDIATYDDEQKKVLDHALKVFKEAKVDSWTTVDKGHVEVKYHIGEDKHSFVYDVKKGVLENVR